MAAGPSVVRYAKRRRVGERLGGRKKIIRGLGGAVFPQAGLRAATEIGGSAEKMIEGLRVVRSRGSPRPWLRAADNHGYRRLPMKMSPLCPMIDLRGRCKDQRNGFIASSPTRRLSRARACSQSNARRFQII